MKEVRKPQNKIFNSCFVCLIVLICFSCSKGEKKIVATYENGEPFIVEYIKTNDKKSEKTFEQHYYQDGKLRLEGSYKDGKKNGVWKYYYQDGSLFAQTDYSKSQNGEKWQIYFNKDSMLVDKQDNIINIAFSNEQTPVSITVKRESGEVFYRFFNSFKIMERVLLRGNIPQGEAMSWYENGNLNSVHYYLDGMQDSSYVVYAESGQKILSGQYKKGTKIGKWEFFSSEGRPLGYEIYDVDGTKLSSADNQGLKYSTTPPSN